MTAEIYQEVPFKFIREKADISSRSGRIPLEYRDRKGAGYFRLPNAG